MRVVFLISLYLLVPILMAQEVSDLSGAPDKTQYRWTPAQPTEPAYGVPDPGLIFQDPPQALRLAIRRHSEVKYAGVRVVEVRRGGRIQTFTQRILRDGQNMRIEYPSDSPFFGQIIVERGPVRFHYVPGKSEILQQPAREDEALNRLMHAVNLRVAARVGNGSTIARRSTDQVTLEMDRDFQFKLWIDKQQGTILRREILERGGQRVGFYEYQSIDYNARIPRDAFQINVPGVRTVTVDQQLKQVAERLQMKPYKLGSNQWQITGVHHMEVKGIGPRGADMRVLISTYAHGWHRVTMFQYKGSVDNQRLTMLLRPNLRSHVWSRDGYTFVLLGELTTQDLERMSGSLRS